MHLTEQSLRCFMTLWRSTSLCKFVYGASRHRLFVAPQWLKHTSSASVSWKPTPSSSRHSGGFGGRASLLNADTRVTTCFFTKVRLNLAKVCTYMHIYIHTYIHIHKVSSCEISGIHTYIHMCVHTHVHTHTYIHTYIH